MGQFPANIFLISFAFILTLLSGYPLSRHIKSRFLISKVVLAFAFGFGIISISGMIGNAIGIDFFKLQAVNAALLIMIFIHSYKKSASKGFGETIKYIKENHVLYLFGALATLVLVYDFSRIIMWAEGDGSFHSSVIRLIVEGEKIPIRLIPAGGEYESYPKGFHFFVAFFVRLFGTEILQAMKMVPILIVLMISIGIFALTEELNFPKPTALFAFMTSFALWKLLYPLVWMGYPSLTADFFLVALILSMYLELKDRYPKLSFFIFISLYLVHPRHFLYSIPILAWMAMTKFKGASFRSFLVSFVSGFLLLFLSLLRFGVISEPRYPVYITNLITGVESITEFIFVWNIGLLALFGIYFSLRRRSPEDWLLLMIFFSWLFLAFLIDTSIFRLDIPDKRSYSKLFIPLSIFTAIFLYRLTSPIRSRRVREYLVAVNTFSIFFLLITSAFINAPILGWVMAETDYAAMKSLERKTGIVVNLDPTGRWIYPLTGIEVTNPRGRVQTLSTTEMEQIISFPNSSESYMLMDDLKKRYTHVYIFISQRTLEKPGYLLFGLTYPKINFEGFMNSDRYMIIYKKGSVILEYEPPSREVYDG